MAMPACFLLADDVFPRVRAEAARRMVESGWSQMKAAGALRVSQAMVSKYVGRPRVEEDGTVLRLADELMRTVEAPTTYEGPSSWCQTLSPIQDEPESQDALSDILAAEQQLLAVPPMDLIPQIGLNLARSRPSAIGLGGILAFPGRMVAAGDRLVSPVPPAWSASTHLGTALLALQTTRPEILALSNVRGNDRIVAAAESVGIKVERLKRSERRGDEPVIECFAQGHQCVYDAGAMGIEPCLYVAAESAIEVVETLHKIQSKLQGTTQ